MHRYRLTRPLGDGSFGSVWEGVAERTGERVAVKRLLASVPTWAAALTCAEVAALTRLSTLSRSKPVCVIRLREVVHQKEDGALFLIFEYAHGDLYKAMARRRNAMASGAPPGERYSSGFTPAEVVHLAGSILRGLAFLHTHGVFHRDMKPENVLVLEDVESRDVWSPLTDAHLRLCDFGQARETRSRPPYTEYVGTRWYRAPECVLGMRSYNSPVDVWAAGAIAAELVTGRPLFPGPASGLAQIHAIMAVMHAPTPETWPEGVAAMRTAGVKPPGAPTTPLEDVLAEAHPGLRDAIMSMLTWDPAKRPSAGDVLAMPFFRAWHAAQEELDRAAAAASAATRPSPTPDQEPASGRNPSSEVSGWKDSDVFGTVADAALDAPTGARRASLTGLSGTLSERRLSRGSASSMSSQTAAVPDKPPLLGQGIALRHARSSGPTADGTMWSSTTPRPSVEPGYAGMASGRGSRGGEDGVLTGRRASQLLERPDEPSASLADSIDRDMKELGLDESLELLRALLWEHFEQLKQ